MSSKEPQGRRVGEARDPVLVDLALPGGGSPGKRSSIDLDILLQQV